MDVLLDSQSILWALGNPDKLSDAALDAFRAAEDGSGVGVSIASLFDLWYATHKRGSSRVEAADFEMVKATLKDPELNFHVAGLSELAVPHIDVCRKSDLADPWDRMIVATALEHGLPLVTSDKAITDLGVVTVVW